ncbi:hypothetical protein [Streptomyces chartreusis]
MGKLRYVVEQTLSLLHYFKRLAVSWERRLDLHNLLVSLACSLIPCTWEGAPPGAGGQSPRCTTPQRLFTGQR